MKSALSTRALEPAFGQPEQTIVKRSQIGRDLHLLDTLAGVWTFIALLLFYWPFLVAAHCKMLVVPIARSTACFTCCSIRCSACNILVVLHGSTRSAYTAMPRIPPPSVARRMARWLWVAPVGVFSCELSFLVCASSAQESTQVGLGCDSAAALLRPATGQSMHRSPLIQCESSESPRSTLSLIALSGSLT